MAEKSHMRQCTLRQKFGGISTETTSWIPEQFAKLGNCVSLKDGDEWEDGWKIVIVGARKEATEVHERSRDHLRQRKASDIPRTAGRDRAWWRGARDEGQDRQ
jgi:hypothetical protein